MLRLLHRDFHITVVAPEISVCRDKEVRGIVGRYSIPLATLKDLPRDLSGVALGICDRDFFSAGRARELKARGAKVVWSNEMMWAFKGEAEVGAEGLVDKVLFVSEFQANASAEIYKGVPHFNTGNYIDPEGL